MRQSINQKDHSRWNYRFFTPLCFFSLSLSIACCCCCCWVQQRKNSINLFVIYYCTKCAQRLRVCGPQSVTVTHLPRNPELRRFLIWWRWWYWWFTSPRSFIASLRAHVGIWPWSVHIEISHFVAFYFKHILYLLNHLLFHLISVSIARCSHPLPWHF